MAVVTPNLAQAPPQVEQPRRMSYKEFLAWAGEDTHAEWVNGEVIVQIPPKYEHQAVVTFLIQLLGLFVRLFRLGEDGIYRSTALPGLWLRAEWLLAEAPPEPLAALAQVVGPDKIMASLQL